MGEADMPLKMGPHTFERCRKDAVCPLCDRCGFWPEDEVHSNQPPPRATGKRG